MEATAEATYPKVGVGATVAASDIHKRMTWSRVIGALFIAGFLSYGIGAALVTSIVGETGFVGTIPTQGTLLIAGVFLMLLNTGVDIGKGVLFFPILEGHSKRTALVYFAAVTAQVVLMAVGALFILMLVPLGGAAAGGADASAAEVGTALAHGNTMAYNIGQAVLSFGGVFLCWLLFRVELVPRALAGLGLVGYVLHGAGSLAELFGLGISLYLLIPGAIFELGLAVYLIVKGFRPEAYANGLSHSGRQGGWSHDPARQAPGVGMARASASTRGRSSTTSSASDAGRCA